MKPKKRTTENGAEILVVEDSPTQAARLKNILESEGYTVTVATNGKAALASIHQGKPSLVLSDILMPGMDGFTLCKEIKAQEELKGVPVILVTSLSSPHDIMKGLECGADSFIRKPYDEKYLLSRIEFVLVNRKLRRTERTQFGVEIYFVGKKYFVTSERQQILDLLISTYEDAVRLNEELQARQKELSQLAEQLERKVEERTAALTAEITERRRAEEALRKSEEQYRLLFQGNPHPMWVYDLDGLSFLAVNDAAVEHYGYSQDEFLAMTIKDIRPAEDIPARMANIGQDPSGLNRSGTWRHRKKDGRIVDVEITSHPLRFAGRRAQLVLATDVTERKHLEEQLRHAQKMEAIGQLAGGVAHDFNNLLTIITGYSELLLERLGADDPQRGRVNEIKKAADRAAALTRQLLAFGRRQVLAHQVLELNAVVANTDKMLRRLIGEDINLVTILDPAVGRVKADPGQLEQVIMNLAVNARDAMPRGGKLTIETANVELDNAYARQHVSVTPGAYVMLAVSDTGQGMDAETQAHIFEPFFTTKEKGKGTGLGLATVYGIVKQSGGNIWVYSEPGRGATLKVYLPRVEEAVTVGVLREAIQVVPRGSETVLLVEDEESVRSLVRGVLEESGYKVLEAQSASHALMIGEGYKEPIHLLLTDVVMPQMSGRELAESLRAGHPKTKVLYMSGYTDDAVVRHGVLESGTTFLQKPFTPDVLARKVRQALDGPPGAKPSDG